MSSFKIEYDFLWDLKITHTSVVIFLPLINHKIPLSNVELINHLFQCNPIFLLYLIFIEYSQIHKNKS